MLHQPSLSTLFPYTTLFRSTGNAFFVLVVISWRSVFERRRQIVGTADRIHRAERARKTDGREAGIIRDRKSTRLNSSHLVISYAVFCLKKKIETYNQGAGTR